MTPSKGKILIVEDEFVLYHRLASMLEKAGYEIVREDEDSAVDNYDSAIRLMQESRPDIALLDIRIKGEHDGLMIGAWIKCHQPIPVVLLSQDYSVATLNRRYQFAIDEFLPKTGNDEHVLAVVDALMKQQRLAPVAATTKTAEEAIITLPTRATPAQTFLTVTAVPSIEKLTGPRKHAEEDDAETQRGVETLISWESILYVQYWPKNKLLLHEAGTGRGYLMRATLGELSTLTPDFMLWISNSFIINTHAITRRKKNGEMVWIDKEDFDVKYPGAIKAVKNM